MGTSSFLELPEGTYTLTLDMATTQYSLKPGWNLISLQVNKCFYEGERPDQPNCVDCVDVVNDLKFNSFEDWFSSILTPKNSWTMVIGADTLMSRELPPEVNSLKFMSPCDGYWVKIEKDTGGAILCVQGTPFQPECQIPVEKGWNLVGCPVNKGYYDTPNHPDIPGITDWQQVPYPVAEHVFWSIYNNIIYIVGEDESYDPNLPEDVNSLHYIAGGLAYWIKMKENDSLDYSPKP
jgi:hypothetical protein